MLGRAGNQGQILLPDPDGVHLASSAKDILHALDMYKGDLHAPDLRPPSHPPSCEDESTEEPFSLSHLDPSGALSLEPTSPPAQVLQFGKVSFLTGFAQ